MAFRPWDPVRDLLALQEQLGQLVGADAPGWTPPTDLYETATEFVMTVEVPGLARQDIELHAEDHRVVVRGSRAADAVRRSVACEQYHRVERGHGRFARAFTLPQAIDPDRVVAELKDGVLTVTLPKARTAGTHRIQVS